MSCSFSGVFSLQFFFFNGKQFRWTLKHHLVFCLIGRGGDPNY